MTATTTRRIREQAFLPMACDIPAGMTLPEYRARRSAGARRRRMPRLRRR